MTKAEFSKSFELLESAFGDQGAERRQFYFRQLEHVPAWAFSRAVRRIIEIRDDRYGFPLVAEIHTALDEVERQKPSADVSDFETREYCQKCENQGFFLNDRGGASPCSCRAGRLKEARMRLGLSARRTEVEEEMKKLPLAEPPFRGLQERNPLGFYEETQEEHDRWMAAKQAEIEEIKKRQAEFKIERDTEKRTISPRTLEKVMREQVAQIDAARKREPGEDEDECPF